MDYQYPFLNPDLPLKDRVRDLISRLTPEEKAGFIPTRNQPVERLGIAAFNFGAEGAHGFVNREGQSTTFPQTIALASSWDRELLQKIGEAVAIEARAVYKMRGGLGGIAIWAPTIDMERDPRWGRNEEGYGEDPYLTGELSSSYILGAQGDDSFYLRVTCAPKHFIANNNEKDRVSCSCSVPQRCLREYYLAPFKTAVQNAKAVSMMTSYNELNGIPVMLHPILKDVVKNEWGIEGNLVTDGGDFTQTVDRHHYFETHAETLAAALKNGSDSITDTIDYVIPAVKEALEKKYITEADLDEHLKRILSVRFRLGHFSPAGFCPYDSIDEKDLMKDKYRDLAREAVRKSVVLLKNDDNTLPLPPEKKQTIAVIGPLADKIYLDWYSGNPPYQCTPLEGLRSLYGEDYVITSDYRSVVSFTAEDGRPLVLADTGNQKGKLLSVGRKGQQPARFFKEDWGWGSFTLTDEESGLMLEAPVWRKTPGGSCQHEECAVTASGKTSLSWFTFTVFNLVPQENGMIIIRTFDNRRIASPPDSAGAEEKAVPVLLCDDPSQAAGELFRMKIEKEGLGEALDTAKNADRIVFIGGNNPMINGREGIDRPSLDLPPFQQEFIRKAAEVNPKIILVLISGYPYTLNDIAEKIPAIVWMAHGIQETGRGLADVLSGAFSPAGRLPMTWYEDEKHLPSIMEYDIISAGTTYQYFNGNVLYPFGYGLGYSKFVYSDLNLDKTSADKDETVIVSFKIKNSGSITAEEVPQLYVTVIESENCRERITNFKPKRPLKTLKGFNRISFAPGEEKNISFTLPVKELAVWDSYENRFCVREGICKVSIGSSSADIRLKGSFKVLGETFKPRKITSEIYAECFDSCANCFLHEKRGSGIPAVFSVKCAEDKSGVSASLGHGENRKYDCAWIHFAALDFTPGFSRFSLVAQGVPGSRVEIRLDAPDGDLIGTLDVHNTGDTCDYELDQTSPRRRQLWSYAETSIKKISGVHDLYLVIYGKTGVWKFGLV